MLSMTRISALSAAALLLVLSGCTAPQPSADAPKANGHWGMPAQADSSAGAKRFQDTALEGRTAVESAIELSEKYARLSDQTATLREENQRLKTENDNLRRQVAATETRLAQTQKELGEANDLLIEMLSELNNWKNNILGFRGEMREAARAQLEALLKVLEVLGGEVEAGTLSQKHAGTLNPQQNMAPGRNVISMPDTEDVNDVQ